MDEEFTNLYPSLILSKIKSKELSRNLHI